MHTWPVVMYVAIAIRAISASSKAASSSTIAGSLPPSSSVTRVRLAAAICMMALPPPTLPVKHTCFTRGSPITTGPITASAPVTTLRTPGGSARAMWRNVRTTDIGVVGGGLTTTVLPAMRAYGRLAPRIARGQLNGKMIVTTPTGT